MKEIIQVPNFKPKQVRFPVPHDLTESSVVNECLESRDFQLLYDAAADVHFLR